MSTVDGFVAPGFESVREEFERNFAERDEVGAACAVYHRGEPVVDLWGGHRDIARTLPWQGDTVVLVLSATKGIAAMALAVAQARGLFDVDAPMARYWPEFAQAGKNDIPVRQVLAYAAGLSVLDEPFTPELVADEDRLEEALARQAPVWAPGQRHGYHPFTLGHYQSALLRRVDGRPVGQFFREEIAQPLGLDLFLGMPADVDVDRIASHNRRSDDDPTQHAHKVPAAFVAELMRPDTVSLPALYNPKLEALELGQPPWRELDMPSVNGIGQVRDIARLYGLFAARQELLGLTPETFDLLEAPPRTPASGEADATLGVNTAYSMGFWRQPSDWRFGTDQRAYGAPGGGGSMGVADPASQIGFAYAPNRLDYYLYDDPREKALRDAVYRSAAGH